MKITIIGAGEVGFCLGNTLSEQKHDVTVIEQCSELASSMRDELNVRVINGNGASAQVLMEAKVNEMDYFLAMTESDAVNLLASSIAKLLGAKFVIARIHRETYADRNIFNYQLHFNLDLLINPEALCAAELGKVIRSPGKMAMESFIRGEIEISHVKVSERSELLGIPLGEQKMDPKMRIGCMRREGELEIPSAESVIKAGDVLTLAGDAEVLLKMMQKLNPDEKPYSRRVSIFGATETGITLGRILSRAAYKVRIIEPDEDLCEKLSKQLEGITIIHGEGTSLRLLEEEQIGDSDYFIACTKDDEDNIMTCLQAKRLGTKHVQLVINKSDYEGILDSIQGMLGVETVVSYRNATINELIRYISSEQYLCLVDLPGDRAKIIEVTVGDGSFKDYKIKDIPWPPETVVIGMLHKYRAKVPTAEDMILSEDKLIIITMKEHIKELLRLLT